LHEAGTWCTIAVGEAKVDQLDLGLLAVGGGSAADDVATRIARSDPVFVEHVTPIHEELPLCGPWEDLDLLRQLARGIRIDRMRPDATVAVECRRAAAAVSGRHADAAYTVRDVEVAVGSALECDGARIDRSRPDVVLHVVLSGRRALLGATTTAASLRTWGNAMRAASVTQICRAEHKLRQAVESFGLELSPDSVALDLGAAPGGWSYVLAGWGVIVDAVDPAEMDGRVVTHPLVRHHQQRAETLSLPPGRYDLVVNDMALDPLESAAVMRAVASSAKPGALGVMTVKLPTRNVSRWLAPAAAALDPCWNVLAARHLAANRQEVTWLVERINSLRALTGSSSRGGGG
jgi:23S rRNA (cytidine2498-2'-O)-methyltransferase